MFSLIAAIGKNRELGKNNQLIFHLKEDMRFFRETTTGHKIVMGRKTWESLPGKLKDRENIVVSSRPILDADLSVSDLPAFIEQYKDTPEEFFIIGGGSLYTAFLPYAKNLYLTEIDASDSAADTFFPEFDQPQYSSTVIKKGTENDLAFAIIKYTKI